MTKSILFAGVALGWTMLAQPVSADPIIVVAAENFYGDVAAQIGGANVAVTSVLSNPDDDPQRLVAGAATAKALSGAKIVIVNGADYDPWMEKLLAANEAPGRREILVASLARQSPGDDPHLWYNPATVRALAIALTVDFGIVDPANRSGYEKAGTAFLAALEPLDAKIAEMRKKYAGAAVIASEPVCRDMAELIGLKVHNQKFALAVMNNSAPNASNMVEFENELRGHKVKVMLYNPQASKPAVQRLLQIAEEEKIPVVGVSETEPADANYQQWMTNQLNALDKALAGSAL